MTPLEIVFLSRASIIKLLRLWFPPVWHLLHPEPARLEEQEQCFPRDADSRAGSDSDSRAGSGCQEGFAPSVRQSRVLVLALQTSGHQSRVLVLALQRGETGGGSHQDGVDLLGDGIDLLGEGGNLLSDAGDLLGDGDNGRATRDWKSESVTNLLTYMGRC